MLLDLCAGETLRIGEVATLTVLAVEADLIQLELKTAEGVRSTVGEVSKESAGGSHTPKANTWAWN